MITIDSTMTYVGANPHCSDSQRAAAQRLTSLCEVYLGPSGLRVSGQRCMALLGDVEWLVEYPAKTRGWQDRCDDARAAVTHIEHYEVLMDRLSMHIVILMGATLAFLVVGVYLKRK